MKVIDTKIPDVKLLEPQVFGDERGFFMETFRDEWFKQNVADRTFVQENHSKSFIQNGKKRHILTFFLILLHLFLHQFHSQTISLSMQIEQAMEQ